MRIKLIRFLILIVVSSSCHSTEKRFTYLLCNDAIKYWNIVNSKEEVGWAYSFDRNKNCYYYYFTKGDCERTRMDDDDLVFEDTWSLKNDSVLRFRSHDRKILSLTQDTLKLEQNGKVLVLVSSKCPL